MQQRKKKRRHARVLGGVGAAAEATRPLAWARQGVQEFWK